MLNRGNCGDYALKREKIVKMWAAMLMNDCNSLSREKCWEIQIPQDKSSHYSATETSD